MALSVKERGQFVATLRHVQVALMETLAAWVPTTPEMEVKLLFGAHIWDLAQHADALGKRTHELRLPLQHSMMPASAYVDGLLELSVIDGASQRIAGFYDAWLPGLATRYRRYLGETDLLMDAPTARIIDRMLETEARMIREANELREQLPALRLSEPDLALRLANREAAVGHVVDCTRTGVAREAA